MGPRYSLGEGKDCAEVLSFDYWRQDRSRITVARITPISRTHPKDGRVVSNFIAREGSKPQRVYKSALAEQVIEITNSRSRIVLLTVTN